MRPPARLAPAVTIAQIWPALSRQRPRSHRSAGFTANRATDLVIRRADRSFTPTHAPMLGRKPIAANARVQAPHAGLRR
jgi:hypothetical protein